MKDPNASGPAEAMKGVVGDVRGSTEEALGAEAGQHDLIRESPAGQSRGIAQRGEEASRGVQPEADHPSGSPGVAEFGAILSRRRPRPGRFGPCKPGNVDMILPANGVPPGQTAVGRCRRTLTYVADEDDFASVWPTLKAFAGRLRHASLADGYPGSADVAHRRARRPRDRPDRRCRLRHDAPAVGVRGRPARRDAALALATRPACDPCRSLVSGGHSESTEGTDWNRMDKPASIGSDAGRFVRRHWGIRRCSSR